MTQRLAVPAGWPFAWWCETGVEKKPSFASSSPAASRSGTKWPTWSRTSSPGPAMEKALFSRTQTQRAADHFLHDLVRAAVDALHARVHVRAGDRELHHEAVAAVQLQALVHHAPLEVGGPELRHRC